MAGDVMPSGGLCWLEGIPGLCIGGFGDDVQPGEGTGKDGDFRWTGEAAADPMTGGDLMEGAAAAVGPVNIPAN